MTGSLGTASEAASPVIAQKPRAANLGRRRAEVIPMMSRDCPFGAQKTHTKGQFA